MDETPDDLIPLTQVIEEYKPARKWWSARIEAGEIAAYKQPGTRALYLSRADVEALLRPQRLAIRAKPRRAVVKRGERPPKQEPTEQEPTDE